MRGRGRGRRRRFFWDDDGPRALSFFSNALQDLNLSIRLSLSLSSETTFFTFDSVLYLGWMSFFIATTWREPRRCEESAFKRGREREREISKSAANSLRQKNDDDDALLSLRARI